MNLRQVRTKIKSVSNVKKITKAMEMVSAVKMRKSQKAALDGRIYNEHLDTVIHRISSGISTDTSPLLRQNEDAKKSLTILISSNKGLAGSFHTNLDRLVLKTTTPQTAYITVGKKAAQFLVRIGASVVADFSDGHALSRVSAVFDMAVKSFLLGEYQTVELLYNKFISTSVYEPTQSILLPLTIQEISKEAKKTEVSATDVLHSPEYLIEPDPYKIIDPLLRSFVEAQIRSAIVSSEAAEHSSRMIAMKNATDNATDVIYSLQLLGNKLRQSKITSELLDMVTAKESVESI